MPEEMDVTNIVENIEVKDYLEKVFNYAYDNKPEGYRAMSIEFELYVNDNGYRVVFNHANKENG